MKKGTGGLQPNEMAGGGTHNNHEEATEGSVRELSSRITKKANLNMLSVEFEMKNLEVIATPNNISKILMESFHIDEREVLGVHRYGINGRQGFIKSQNRRKHQRKPKILDVRRKI